MYPTPSTIAPQVAHDYARDRHREAGARRAARAARAAGAEQGVVDVAPTPVAAVRRWWVHPARPTPA